MPKRTNNPDGRPKTARDHKRRAFYATVTASPAEASELDAQRGDTDRATFLRERGLMPVVEPAKEPE